MRKGLIAAAAVMLLLGGGGYAGLQYGKKMIADRVMDEVIGQVLQDEEVRRLLDDPEVRRKLREAVAEEDLKKLRGEIGAKLGGGSDAGTGDGSPAAGGGSMPVASIEEAEELVLDKFSIGEIRRYAAMVQGGLTEEEKQRIRDEVLSRFTEEELRALKLLALIEAEKRQGDR